MKLTYKLVRTETVPLIIENKPIQYRRQLVTVQTGLTADEAKAAKKLDRTLTAVREIVAAPVTVA